MKKKALYLVAVFGLLLTTACGTPKLKNGEEVVAKIDGKEYSADELYQELKSQYGYNTLMTWIDSEIADKEVETTKEIEEYVDEAIDFYQSYAQAYGMTLPAFAQSYLGLTNVQSEEDVKNYILSDRKLSLAIERKVGEQLSDSEIEKYYNDNYKTTYTYKDILVVSEKSDDLVKEMKKKLKDKKKDDLLKEFDKLSTNDKYSKNENEENEVKDATKNKVDSAIWNKLKDMDDYDYASVTAEDGVHFILRVSKNDGQNLDEVKDEIISNLAQQKLQEDQFLSYDMLNDLRNKYKLAFFDEDLKSSYDDFLNQLSDAKEQASKSNSNSNEKEGN